MNKYVRKLMVLCMIILPALAFAQEAAQPAGQVGDDSVLDLILKGGPVMVPLFLCSLAALAIIFERSVGLQKKKLIPENFLSGLKASVDEDRKTFKHAVAFCDGASTPIARVFKAGLANAGRGLEAAEKAIEDAGGREVDKLKRSVRGLAVIASVSPLLGLLGTVYGMIGAFKEATVAGVGKGESLAGGIYEALVTTAAGLTIAVPVLLVYQYLNMRIDGLVDDIDEMGIDFIQHLALEDKSA